MKANPKTISAEQMKYLYQVKRNSMLISLSRLLLLFSFILYEKNLRKKDY